MSLINPRPCCCALYSGTGYRPRYTQSQTPPGTAGCSEPCAQEHSKVIASVDLLLLAAKHPVRGGREGCRGRIDCECVLQFSIRNCVGKGGRVLRVYATQPQGGVYPIHLHIFPKIKLLRSQDSAGGSLIYAPLFCTNTWKYHSLPPPPPKKKNIVLCTSTIRVLIVPIAFHLLSVIDYLFGCPCASLCWFGRGRGGGEVHSIFIFRLSRAGESVFFMKGFSCKHFARGWFFIHRTT